MGPRPVALIALPLALLLAAACGKSDAQAHRGGAPAVKAVPITVTKAEAREVQRAVETVGSVVAWQETIAKTEQPGTVAKLLVDLGDRVSAGQVLAEYDAREFQLSVRQ